MDSKIENREAVGLKIHGALRCTLWPLALL